MSYFKKIEYEIVVEESFPVIRNCAGCGRKTHFKNTNKFRVNANGNKLDVWLIYQCENCKHTWNLSVHERQRPDAIRAEDYQRFLANDEAFAESFGRDMKSFQKNRAAVDLKNIKYHIEKRNEILTEEEKTEQEISVKISNPYGLKIRAEKQIADATGLSRSQVKRLTEQGKIKIEMDSPQMLAVILRDGSLLAK